MMMRNTVRLPSILSVTIALLATQSAVHAEIPPQPTESASLVVVGVIEYLEVKNAAFCGDGVRTDFVATLRVLNVAKGDGVKPNDTIRVHWYGVTRWPSMPPPGAYGHVYPVAVGMGVSAFLSATGPIYEVIYNAHAIEPIDIAPFRAAIFPGPPPQGNGPAVAAGALIVDVRPGSPATRVFNMEDGKYWWLEPGDVITHLNDLPIRSEAEYYGLQTPPGGPPGAPCKIRVVDRKTGQPHIFLVQPEGRRIGIHFVILH